MASGYVICNLIFGIETVGWSLLGCLFVAGIPGGLAGSAAAGAVYDEATATPLQRALHELQSQPENVRRLFASMVSASTPRGGLPITEEFVRGFIRVVPADLGNDEVTSLTGQLTSIAPGDNLQGVLDGLQRSISQLPRRRVIVDIVPVAPRLLTPPVSELYRGIDILGTGRIQVLPPIRSLPPNVLQPPDGPLAPTIPLLEINILP
jgi:hypothetical protein